MKNSKKFQAKGPVFSSISFKKTKDWWEPTEVRTISLRRKEIRPLKITCSLKRIDSAYKSTHNRSNTISTPSTTTSYRRDLARVPRIMQISTSYSRYTRRALRLTRSKSKKAIKTPTITPTNQKIALLSTIPEDVLPTSPNVTANLKENLKTKSIAKKLRPSSEVSKAASVGKTTVAPKRSTIRQAKVSANSINKIFGKSDNSNPDKEAIWKIETKNKSNRLKKRLSKFRNPKNLQSKLRDSSIWVG